MPAERKCPLCGRPTEERFKPFCSRRCADLDLGHWLKGSYAIPAVEAGEETPDDEDEQREPTGPGPKKTPPSH